eukprot:15326248-Ditylum_brightwellii.AAC.1
MPINEIQSPTWVQHMLPIKQRAEADLKELKKKLGIKVKVEVLAVWQAKMTKETRRIVGKWYKLGKWVFYLTQVVCKTQLMSILTAGVTYKSGFAKDIMGIFLKTDWSEKETWSKEKLWMGDLT